MRTRAPRTHAFTLIELLVVIAIIVVVAGLVVALAGVAGESSKTKRTQTELAKLVTLIDAYKSKVGVYPPDNPANSGRNSLLYELAGATRTISAPYSALDPGYLTTFTNVSPYGQVAQSVLFNRFGIYANGVINAVDESGDAENRAVVKLILKELKPDQFATVAPNTISLVIPVDGPGGRPNPWNYWVGTNAVRNPDTYDLWVDIVVRGKTNRIGNWKN